MSVPAPLNDTTRDWALLVGIDGYPSLHGENRPGDLEGAVADMEEFEAFLANEYLVHGEQMIRVQSPHPSQPNQPVSMAALARAKAKLYSTYRELRQNGPDWQQRRIYIFMSGHGFIPHEEEKRALILAESVDPFFEHFVAQDAVSFFAATKMFKEVLLFMDCCAVRTFDLTPNSSVWPAAIPQDEDLPPTKVFKVFAAKGDQPTREFPVKGSGNVRGVFTQFLLKALRGDEHGKVSTSHVFDVFNEPNVDFRHHLKDIFDLDETFRFLPYCPSDPHFDIFEFETANLVDVPLQLTDGLRLENGDRVEAWDDGAPIHLGTVASNRLTLDLPEGIVKLRFKGETNILVAVHNRTIIDVSEA